MNFNLTDEQQLIGQSAREFAQENLAPIAVEMDHTGAYPAEIVDQLAGMEFLALLQAADHGGVGAGFVAYAEVVEALSRHSAAVATILNQHALAAYAIEHWGSDRQKAKYLPALAKGELLGSIAVTENGTSLGEGADALMAVQKDQGYVLNGAKTYVRNAGKANLYVVFASAETAPGRKELSAFVVEDRAEGLKVGCELETMGLKGCPVAHLNFQNVLVSGEALLGSAGTGAKALRELLAVQSLMEAAQTVGIGQCAVEHAAKYAKERVQFGKPIAALQAIQTLLAEVATDIHLARLGLRNAAALIEEGKPFEMEAAMVRSFLARVGSKMLIDTCQVEGGFGFSEFMPLPRLFRDIAGTTLLDVPADFPEGVVAQGIA